MEVWGKIWGVIIGVALFFIMLVICGISGCVSQNSSIKHKKEVGKTTVTIRYYYSVQYDENEVGDYENAKVAFDRVKKKKGDSIPTQNRQGYIFVGYFSDPSTNPTNDSKYTDETGKFIRNLTKEDEKIVLYPFFVKEGF